MEKNTYCETFNKDKLAYILSHKKEFKSLLIENAEDSYDPFDVAEKYYASSINGRIRIKYSFASGKTSGRIFCNAGVGMQMMHRKIRNAIATEYCDIDVVNSHAVMLKHIINKLNIQSAMLDEYINDRSRILQDIGKNGKTRVLAVINGGEKKYIGDSKWLQNFHDEIQTVRGKIGKIYGINSYSDLSSKISGMMCNLEYRVLESMYEYFSKPNSAVLCHDGIMIPKNINIDISACERSIELKTGIAVNLKIKPMDDKLIVPDIYCSYEGLYKDFDVVFSIMTSTGNEGDRPYIVNKMVSYMNKKHSWVKASKSYIISKLNLGYDSNICYQNKKSVEQDYKNRTYYISPKLALNLFDVWYSSHRRAEYNGVEFSPSNYYNCDSKKIKYNLFSGLAIEKSTLDNIEPLEESHEFFNHILRRWCKGNINAYNYVLNWFAHLIQKPWEKMRSCLVLRSCNRAGKGIVVKKIIEIIGDIYAGQPTSQDQIFGSFNSSLTNKLLVFLDELVWGGDKEKAGVFKKLITESKHSINEKFMPVVEIENLSNLIVATNEDWGVPAGMKETRFMVLDVSSELTEIKDKKLIIDQIRKTPARRLAKFLYERDIKTWQSDDIVITDGLRFQKIQSLQSVARWWLDCLNRSKYHGIYAKDVLYNDYKEVAHDKHMSASKFWILLKQYTNHKTFRQQKDGTRNYYVELPNIEELRNIWRNCMGDTDWVFD